MIEEIQIAVGYAADTPDDARRRIKSALQQTLNVEAADYRNADLAGPNDIIEVIINHSGWIALGGVCISFAKSFIEKFTALAAEKMAEKAYDKAEYYIKDLWDYKGINENSVNRDALARLLFELQAAIRTSQMIDDGSIISVAVQIFPAEKGTRVHNATHTLKTASLDEFASAAVPLSKISEAMYRIRHQDGFSYQKSFLQIDHDIGRYSSEVHFTSKNNENIFRIVKIDLQTDGSVKIETSETSS